MGMVDHANKGSENAVINDIEISGRFPVQVTAFYRKFKPDLGFGRFALSI